MSWKSSGLSIIRKAFDGRIFEEFKFKNLMSTWKKCEIKAHQHTTENCPTKTLMDEAPVPEGPWHVNFARKNERDNKMLFIGVTSFVVSLLYLKKNGFVKGHPEITLF